MPAVSVLLPVHNGQPYLRESIQSILAQSLTDLELLVIDDASTDDSKAVAKSFTDSRLVLITNDKNLGLAEALNVGIQHATSDLIARHDQDDLAAPTRLAKQVDFLHRNPQVGVVGAWAHIITTPAQTPKSRVRQHRHPSDDAEIRWRLLWNSPFVHSSVVMRRDLVLEVGGYSGETPFTPEDYDLWVRLADLSGLANLPEFLQSYRETESGMSRTYAVQISEGVTRISCHALAEVLPDATDEQVKGLALALNGQRPASISLTQAFKRLALLRQASTSVSGFKIRKHLGTYMFTALRVLRNSLVKHREG